jgi:TP901 family phage tail tape measure protein
MGQAQKATRALSSETVLLGGAFGKAYRSLLPYIGAFAGFQALAIGTRRAQEFGKAIAEIASIADASILNITDLRENLVDIGVSLGVREAEVATGAYQAISAGIEGTTASITEFTKQSARLARVGLADVGATVDILTSILNAYKLEVSDTASVVDVLFRTVQRGKTTIPELATTLGRTIPLASALGISLEEVSAALVVLTKSGLRTDIATTSLRGVFSQLLDPSEEAVALYRKLGIEITKTRIQTEGFLPVLRDLATLTGPQLTRAIPDVRAGTGAEILTRQLADVAAQLEAVNEAASDTTDVVGDALATFLAFEEVQAEITLNAISQAISEVGRELIILFNEVAEGIFGPIENITELRRVVRSLTRTITGAAGTIRVALSPLTELIRSIGVGLTDLDGLSRRRTLFEAFIQDPAALLSTLKIVPSLLKEIARQSELQQRGALDPEVLRGAVARLGPEIRDELLLTFRDLSPPMREWILSGVEEAAPEAAAAIRQALEDIEGPTIIPKNLLSEATGVFLEQLNALKLQTGEYEYLVSIARDLFDIETDLLAQRLEAQGATDAQIDQFFQLRELLARTQVFDPTGGAGVAQGFVEGIRVFSREANDLFARTSETTLEFLRGTSDVLAESIIGAIARAEDIGEALREGFTSVLEDFANRLLTSGFDLLFSQALRGVLPDVAISANTSAVLSNTLALASNTSALLAAAGISPLNIGTSFFGTGSLPVPAGGIPGPGLTGGIYGEGGIITRPTLALMGEGRDDEAVIPLSSGSVPVEMRGGGSTSIQTGDFVMNVTAPQGFSSMSPADRRRFLDEIGRAAKEGQASALRQAIRDIGRER